MEPRTKTCGLLVMTCWFDRFLSVDSLPVHSQHPDSVIPYLSHQQDV